MNRETQQFEFDPLTPENEEVRQWYDIKGPTKTYNFCISVDRTKQFSAYERVALSGTLVLHEDQQANSPRERGEGTRLMLTAVQKAVEVAIREQLPFRWFFNPTDRQGKMKQWEEQYISSGIIRTEVEVEELPSYLQHVQQMLETLPPGTSFTPELAHIENQDARVAEIVKRTDEINRQIDG